MSVWVQFLLMSERGLLNMTAVVLKEHWIIFLMYFFLMQFSRVFFVWKIRCQCAIIYTFDQHFKNNGIINIFLKKKPLKPKERWNTKTYKFIKFQIQIIVTLYHQLRLQKQEPKKKKKYYNLGQETKIS